jgi:hypothetical protein
MPKKKAGDKPVKAKSDFVGSDWILLTEITADPDVQARVELDEEVVADYSRAMLEQVDTEEGLKFPPCIVFSEGGKTLWLSDGFHRFNAAQRTGGKVDRLDCEIRQGGKRDAMLFAFSANVFHGLRPTNEDKRKAVSRMLQDDEWRQWVDREIARRCGVAHSFVGKIRAELKEAIGGAIAEDPEQRRTYITKHGTPSTMKTGGRRKPRKPVGDDDNDQQVEDDESSSTSVAEPDLGAVEVEALRANGEPTDDKRALQDKITALEGANELLRNEIESLRSGTAAPEGSLSEFQAAIDKWRDTVETQKVIIAQRDGEIASLRAGIAAAPTGEPQTMTQLFNRAVDTLTLIDSATPDQWPKKISKQHYNQHASEVHRFLARMRGIRDVIELHSGESEEGQP